MTVDGCWLSETKRDQLQDKGAAYQHDVHLQITMEQFVHGRSLSLIFPTDALYAAAVTKQITVCFKDHTCRTSFIYYCIYPY